MKATVRKANTHPWRVRRHEGPTSMAIGDWKGVVLPLYPANQRVEGSTTHNHPPTGNEGLVREPWVASSVRSPSPRTFPTPITQGLPQGKLGEN
jgi:hypothetical protein